MSDSNSHKQSADSTFTFLVNYTIAELERVREIVKNGQEIEQALSASLASLQKVDLSKMSSFSLQSGEATEKFNALRLSGYPYKGAKEEKVIFILRKNSMAMRVSEVAKEIIHIEGGDYGHRVSKALNYIMNQMVADGELLVTKIKGSNRHTFFCLVEFFSSLEKGNIVLKEEHYPSEESWGKLPAEDRNFNKTKWIGFLKN